jgi:hypothetical protein|tara:strand:- start:27 stop:260 length:234 start_codon:yes stop_codon:yes gene_type:complete
MNNKSFDIDADYETVVVELAVYPDSRGVRRDTYGFIEDEFGLLEESGIYLQKIVEDVDVVTDTIDKITTEEKIEWEK